MEQQPILNLAEICHQQGVTDAILSPGSRCAPLVVAFTRHPGITCKTIPDERSAAFIALGMAEKTKKPIVLICTSGSAAFNYAPAVAEAFFREIPLIILTADRPPEWIGQQDGQTIYQDNIYGKHVLLSATAPVDRNHPDALWQLYQLANKCLITSTGSPSGPVHLNIPFREPFYPGADEETYFETEVPVTRSSNTLSVLSESMTADLEKRWPELPKKLILAGQGPTDLNVLERLKHICEAKQIPLIGDIISNMHLLEDAAMHADVYLSKDHTEASNFQPDLLLTFGLSILSKNVKQFLRNHPPREHWHIQTKGPYADTFQCLTQIINTDPETFFESVMGFPESDDFGRQKQHNYQQLWQIEEGSFSRKLNEFFPAASFGEFEIVYELLKTLPENCNLHLANSMAVRYANYIGIEQGKNIEIFSNRGTCGIDGATSTAVGIALSDAEKLNFLITGDVGFFYDRNAFWHNYALPNLRIILLNNHGGGIFRMIQGPGQLPELDEYFETNQQLNARSLCDEFGIEYMYCDKRSKVRHQLGDLVMADKRCKLLEMESESTVNHQIMIDFRKAMS